MIPLFRVALARALGDDSRNVNLVELVNVRRQRCPIIITLRVLLESSAFGGFITLAGGLLKPT